jgi:hypothetical protein
MSQLKIHDAVLLTVACLYSERTMTHPVLFRDVARGVARLYELPDQSPTQMIDEKLAEEIGVDKTITFNKTITFEDVVKDRTFMATESRARRGPKRRSAVDGSRIG